MTVKPDTMNPYNDPLVSELMQSPVIAKFTRLQFLLAAAAMADQATTSTMPQIAKAYDGLVGIAQEEADKPDARVYIGDTEIWARDADCFSKETAEPALLVLLAQRPAGTKARVEHYNGDRYEVHATFVIGESGVIHRTPEVAAAAA